MNRKTDLKVSFNNDIRKITVNNQTKIYEFIKRSLDVYDLNLSNIAGIYFFYVDANVYLGDNEENDLNVAIENFLSEYEDYEDRIFIIDPILFTRRSTSHIENFKQKYQLLSNLSYQNYYFRPTISITNNYGTTAPETQEFSFEYPNNTRNTRRRSFFNTEEPRQTNPQPNVWSYYGNGGRSSAFLSPLNFFSTIASTNPNNGINSYENIISALNSFLNTNHSELQTLNEEQINTLKRGAYRTLLNEGFILEECTQCNITLEDFSDNTDVIALPCKHAFQYNAIHHWLLRNSNKCPVCRAEVISNI